MPDLPWLVSATGFAIATAASPGPNNTMLAASGANFGLRATLPHMLGVALGFPLMLGAVALGAAGALTTAPGAMAALRWIGAAYLLWLAWRIATAAPVAADPTARRPQPLSFIGAALFQWINPKAWLMAASATVTYIATDTRVTETATLVTIFVLVSLVSVALWTLVGAGAAHLLRTPTNLRRFNLVMAALLLASLIPVVLS